MVRQRFLFFIDKSQSFSLLIAAEEVRSSTPACPMVKSDAEIGDIKRARMLFDLLVRSNPKHAPGWIAAACLEEHAGRMVAARKIKKQGCEQYPKSEDVWLEAARLHVGYFYFY